jgi:hypothetical protein
MNTQNQPIEKTIERLPIDVTFPNFVENNAEEFTIGGHDI